MYVLDGQGREYYNNAKSIIDYLVWSYQIMPVIVVGIHSDNRGKEFVPKNRALPENDPKNTGQAAQLQEHIEKEIFPLIADSFRISPFRALIGHSRGGAFIANTLFSDKKDMFNAYIAISPGMHYLDRQLLKDAEKMITSGAMFHKFYFCAYGTTGELEKYFKPQVLFLDSLFKAHPNKSIIWKQQQIDKATHWTVVAPALVAGLTEMSRAYQPDHYLIEVFAENTGKTMADQIDQYYAHQKQILHYTLPIGAPSLRYYGNQQTEYEAYSRAAELYTLCLKDNPNDIRAYSSLGWAYKNLGKKEKATATYKDGLKILESNPMKWEQKQLDRWKKSLTEALAEL